MLALSLELLLVLHYRFSPIEGDKVQETDVEAGRTFPTMQRTSSLRDKQLFSSEGGFFLWFLSSPKCIYVKKINKQMQSEVSKEMGCV